MAIVAAPTAGQPQGRLLYIRGGNVWTWRDGQETQLTTDGNFRQPRWSPDGTRMIVVRTGDSYDDLWLYSADGQGLRRLVANQSKTYQPNSSAYVRDSFLLTGPSWGRLADGSDRIIYSSDRNGAALGLWIMNRLGETPQQIFGTKPLTGHIEGAALSPDGNLVAFVHDQTDPATGVRATQLYIVDLNTGTYRQVVAEEQGAYDPAWSPDGRWLAYAVRQCVDSRCDDANLFVIHPDGSGRQRLTDGGRQRGVTWSPDGSQLAFARQQGSGWGIFYVNLTSTANGLSADKPQRLGDFADLDPTSGIGWTR